MCALRVVQRALLALTCLAVTSYGRRNRISDAKIRSKDPSNVGQLESSEEMNAQGSSDFLRKMALLLQASQPGAFHTPIARASRSFGSSSARASASKMAEEEEEKKSPPGGGHVVPAGQPELSEEEKALQIKVMEHQKAAPRLTLAEDARSLVAYSTGFGVLSTNSKQFDGYPSGSVVGFATDSKGLPIFCFSGMSFHTQDLLADGKVPRAALTITANGFKGASDGRVTLLGDMARVKKDEVDELREIYMKKHPNAFWTSFKDFSWFRMSELKAARIVGGFARAGDLAPQDYQDAEVDPIQAFAQPVMAHMNADHGDSTKLMLQHYIGMPADELEEANLVQMDKLGFNVQCLRKGQSFKLRLPFTRAAVDRKDVKTIIVQMTQEAAKDMKKDTEEAKEEAKEEETAQ